MSRQTTFPPLDDLTLDNIDELRRLAREGHPQAMGALGLHYYVGDYVPQDFDEARYWSEKGQLHGDPTALYCLGLMYDRGEGVPRDAKLAFAYYFESAHAGYAASMTNLGLMYAEGEAIERDLKEAFNWMKKGAEAGDAMACYNLADMYAKGDGVEPDPEMTVRYYEKAAEEEPDAWVRLAEFYFRGAPGFEPDRKKGHEALDRGMEAGSLEAIDLMGHLFIEGAEGFPKDVEHGLELVREAVRYGSAQALHHLSFLYDEGRVVPKDPAEAERLCEEAAEQDYSPAVYDLAVKYYDDEKDEVKQMKAKALFERALVLGEFDADYFLGEIAWEEARTGEPPKEAVDHWREGAENGSAACMGSLGRTIYLQAADTDSDKLAEGVAWLRPAAEGRIPEACYYLADAYLYGRGVETDFAEGHKWLLKAYELGMKEALVKIAYDYAFGVGVEKDIERGVEAFESAAAAEQPEAFYYLGLCYRRGYGVVQNIERAREYFEAAVQRGVNRAMASLGELFFRDPFEEGTRDFRKAVQFWTPLINTEPEAMADYGVLLFEGGTDDTGYTAPKDPERGLKLIRRAIAMSASEECGEAKVVLARAILEGRAAGDDAECLALLFEAWDALVDDMEAVEAMMKKIAERHGLAGFSGEDHQGQDGHGGHGGHDGHYGPRQAETRDEDDEHAARRRRLN